MVVAGGLLAGLAVLPACGTMRLGETADPIVTGSIKPQPVALRVAVGDAPEGISAGDWMQAKLALEQALASPDKAASIPWDNPGTGAAAPRRPSARRARTAAGISASASSTPPASNGCRAPPARIRTVR
ncbi:MAG: hypothetical protein B7Y84_08895 [Azorhizobium sp. 32-67-21]|nr:MAG: hypothetical protein B7Y84_08895 [Azorhizobium sp. 32-67-21]